MLKEFREFAIRGNVMDLAVGIIIGAAFTAVVNSLAADLLTPTLGVLIGGVDFVNWFVVLRGGTEPGPYASLAAARAAGAVTLNLGQFLNAVIGFLLTAVAVFALVKTINAVRRAEADRPQAEKSPAPTREEVLLAEIRDALRGRTVE